MIENFDIDRVSVRGPVFDPEKLDWLSGQPPARLGAPRLRRPLQRVGQAQIASHP